MGYSPTPLLTFAPALTQSPRATLRKSCAGSRTLLTASSLSLVKGQAQSLLSRAGTNGILGWGLLRGLGELDTTVAWAEAFSLPGSVPCRHGLRQVPEPAPGCACLQVSFGVTPSPRKGTSLSPSALTPLNALGESPGLGMALGSPLTLPTLPFPPHPQICLCQCFHDPAAAPLQPGPTAPTLPCLQLGPQPAQGHYGTQPGRAAAPGELSIYLSGHIYLRGHPPHRCPVAGPGSPAGPRPHHAGPG